MIVPVSQELWPAWFPERGIGGGIFALVLFILWRSFSPDFQGQTHGKWLDFGRSLST